MDMDKEHAKRETCIFYLTEADTWGKDRNGYYGANWGYTCEYNKLGRTPADIIFGVPGSGISLCFECATLFGLEW